MTERALNFSIATIIIFLVGCAVTAKRAFVVPQRYEDVFTAAQQAVVECGFGITQSNKAEGFISSSQGVVMGKHSTVMNVITKKEGKGASVSVIVVPPPGMVGDTAGIAEEFEASLRRNLR